MQGKSGGLSMRAERAGGSIFDNPDGGEAANASPPAEWAEKSSAMLSDMRSHLQRRRKRADADQILGRGGLFAPFFAIVDFFRSEYFMNVRRSFSILLGTWFWYVLNTRTYTPPEYDD